MPLLFPVEIAFLAMASALGAFILYRTENMWLRPLVEALQHPHGSWIKRTVFKAVGFLARATLFVERRVRSVLSHFAAASLHLLTRWFNGLAAMVHHTLKEIGDLASDTAHAIETLVHHTIPAIVGRITHPVDVRARAALKSAQRSISLIREADRRLSRGIDRLRHEITSVVLARIHGIDRLLHERVLPGLSAAERAVSGVITRDLPALRAREKALEREVYGDLRSRIGRIEKALGLGLLAGLVYKVLARVAPWLFCRNVNKVGRAVCGMNDATLNGLLALVLGTLAIRDLETLARFAVEVEEETAKEVKRLLSA